MDLHGESGFIRGKWNHPLDFHHLSWAAHPQGWWGGGGWGSAGVREPEAAPSEEPTRLGGFLTTYFAIHISLPTPSKPAGLCLLARGACQGPFLRCRGRMLELIKIRVGAESCLKPAPARGGGGERGTCEALGDDDNPLWYPHAPSHAAARFAAATAAHPCAAAPAGTAAQSCPVWLTQHIIQGHNKKKIKDINEAFKVLGLLMVFSNGVSVHPSSQ